MLCNARTRHLTVTSLGPSYDGAAGRKIIFNSKTKLPLGGKRFVKLSFSGSNDGAELAYNPGPDQVIHTTTGEYEGGHDVVCHANWLGPCFDDDDLHFSAKNAATLLLGQLPRRTSLARRYYWGRFRSISAGGRALSCSNIANSLATPPGLQHITPRQHGILVVRALGHRTGHDAHGQQLLEEKLARVRHAVLRDARVVVADSAGKAALNVRLDLGRCGDAGPDFLLCGSRQSVNIRGTSVAMSNHALCKSKCPTAKSAPTSTFYNGVKYIGLVPPTPLVPLPTSLRTCSDPANTPTAP